MSYRETPPFYRTLIKAHFVWAEALECPDEKLFCWFYRHRHGLVFSLVEIRRVVPSLRFSIAGNRAMRRTFNFSHYNL